MKIASAGCMLDPNCPQPVPRLAPMAEDGEVSRSLGFGKNAAGFTMMALNWLEDVRYLARSSSSAMISSRPDGSVAMIHDPDDAFDDP